MQPDPAARQPGDRPAKRLDRRAVLGALAAAAAGAALPRPLAAGAAAEGASDTAGAASLRPLATGVVPRSFSWSELAVLERAVDRILPDTDTPGAAAAGVHWYLDDVARIETPVRDGLKRAAALLDARCRGRFGVGFAAAEAARQDAVLAGLESARDDGRRAFNLLKRETVDAYYVSEIGQIGELGWVGHEFHARFPGACPHEDPLVHPRPGWPEGGDR
jgi:glucoside 3-dehydrogenase (cytochrome c) hitch-hiker subunit